VAETTNWAMNLNIWTSEIIWIPVARVMVNNGGHMKMLCACMREMLY
jgi:hypothetical protein